MALSIKGKRCESKMAQLPSQDGTGGIPAVVYIRVLMARRIMQARELRGWSQAELARQAGIRIETLNRIEKCKHSADPKTIGKIEAALVGKRG